jgi:sigma-B regulation protein RsbU (phosphoserine phosphatase)
MMALTEMLPAVGRNGIGNHSVPAFRRSAEGEKQAMPATAKEPSENIHSVRAELDVMRREHARLQQAIYEAAQVQRRLCAPRELVWGNFEIAGEIFPVRHLSGDFFKVLKLDSVLGLAVGDIAGKGLSAGIWQAHLMGLMQRCARRQSDPAEAIAEVNRELFQEGDERPLIALFFARLNPRESELSYCNAGLPPPLLIGLNNVVERLEIGGPMLGALEAARFNAGKVRLNPGDMLMAYSDGVTECRNRQDEEFETERLSAAARAVRGASANQALFSTLAKVLDFADACPPADDLTLLVVRHRGENKKEAPRARGRDSSATLRERTSVPRMTKAGLRGNYSE